MSNAVTSVILRINDADCATPCVCDAIVTLRSDSRFAESACTRIPVCTRALSVARARTISIGEARCQRSIRFAARVLAAHAPEICTRARAALRNAELAAHAGQ